MTKTFGPAYNEQLDGVRVEKQHIKIRDFMLQTGQWWTLAELHQELNFPEASISAQLRHLRKKRFGAYTVRKRRKTETGGTWEYKVFPKETLFDM